VTGACTAGESTPAVTVTERLDVTCRGEAELSVAVIVKGSAAARTEGVPVMIPVSTSIVRPVGRGPLGANFKGRVSAVGVKEDVAVMAAPTVPVMV
jgi:hypothetical protein